MDERLTRIRELITTIEQAEGELSSLMAGAVVKRDRKPQVCGKCGSAEHNARACTVVPFNGSAA